MNPHRRRDRGQGQGVPRRHRLTLANEAGMRATPHSRQRLTVNVVALVALLGGCGPAQPDGSVRSGAEEPASPEGLADTAWRLVEFQSMSDEVGTVRPGDPSLYTLSFVADGSVSLRLDCNRGTGTWSATPSSPTEGGLELGPVAATRALCPPPSLDERIATDLGFVRSYMIREDRLYLSLMADGGIYVWEWIPDPA